MSYYPAAVTQHSLFKIDIDIQVADVATTISQKIKIKQDEILHTIHKEWSSFLSPILPMNNDRVPKSVF